MDGERSFTLFEMVIVVAILSILASIVLVKINPVKHVVARWELQAQGREVLHTLISCRNSAVIDGYTRKIFIFKDKIYIQTEGDFSQTKKIEFKDSISVVSNTYQGKRLELKPIGTVNYGGHFTLENTLGHRVTIVIQIGTGRIYLKEGAFNS